MVISGMNSKEGSTIKAQLLSLIRKCDADSLTTSSIQIAVKRLSYARSLNLLLGDSSEILKSQLILAEQYFLNHCYDLSVTYALEIVEKDPLVEHRLRAELILLKHKIQQGSAVQALEQIQSIRIKYQDNKAWDIQTRLGVQRLQATLFSSTLEYQKAVNTLEVVMQGFTQCDQQHTIEFAHILVQSASNLFMLDNSLKASAQQKQAITIFEVCLKKDAEELVKFYLDLAKYQQKSGCLQGQYQSLLRAKKIHKSNTSEVNKSTLQIQRKLGLNLQSRGMLPKALMSYQLLRDLVDQRFGSYSQEMAEIKRQLGKMYELVNKRPEAMTQYSEASNLFSYNKDNQAAEECRKAMGQLKSYRSKIYQKSISTL